MTPVAKGTRPGMSSCTPTSGNCCGWVTVMVGSCEFAHDIDVERATTARERAQRQLEEMRQTEHGEDVYDEYQEAFSRAVTRIAVSEKFKT